MTKQERNGRLFLRLMFGLWIVAELLLITISVARHGAGELKFGIVRLILTLGLMYAVISGKRWSRRVLVVLVPVTLVLFDYSVLQRPLPITLYITVYLVVLLYGLLFSTSVKAYLHVRKQTHPIGQGAPPHIGPALPVRNSAVTEGPPSVSRI
jgi:hypothetical protein